MFRDIIMSILTAFIIEPVEADLRQSLQAAGAPVEVVSKVSTCARTAAPALAEKAASDWMWAARTTVKVTFGWKDSSEVLATYAPDCAAALEAANKYLEGNPFGTRPNAAVARPDV